MVHIIFRPSARSTRLRPLGPPGAARLRRPRALLLPAALGALLLGPPADAIELTVEGPAVEDARGSAAAGRAPEVGDELYIRCRLAAQGAGAPDAVSFVFRVDGTVVRELRVPVRIGAPIAIGEYWTPATPGPHEVACEANPDRKVEEAIYADNLRQRTVEVLPRGSAPAQAAPTPKPVAPPPPSAGPSVPTPSVAGPPAIVAAPAPAAPAPKPGAPPSSDPSALAPPAAGPPATARTPAQPRRCRSPSRRRRRRLRPRRRGPLPPARPSLTSRSSRSPRPAIRAAARRSRA